MANVCPLCNSELIIPAHALLNAETYRTTVITVTECCGGAITVKAFTKYVVNEYAGGAECDDWGNKIKKNEKR